MRACEIGTTILAFSSENDACFLRWFGLLRSRSMIYSCQVPPTKRLLEVHVAGMLVT